MRIEVLCPHFEPDDAPTGAVMTAIVKAWAEQGHQIDVITSIPWYRTHAIEPDWSSKPIQTETVEWGTVTRLYPFPSNKGNVWTRAMGFGGFTALSVAAAVPRRRAVDVVMAMSPPLTLGPAGRLIALRRRAPFVFNVQDIFPDVAVELGVISGARTISAFELLERRTYQMADAVTVLSSDLRDNVVAKLSAADDSRSNASKVEVIPNFVDLERIDSGSSGDEYRNEFGLDDRIVVMYAGNVGQSQSLGMVIAAARRFEDRDDVVFVINGNGVARAELEQAASGLDNIVFVDFQPPERHGEVLAAADIHLVPLRAGLSRSSVPSKFYSILGASRPVIAAVDSGSELERVIEANEVGISVEADNTEAFISAIGTLIDAPDTRVRFGVNGRRFVDSWLSPAGVAQRYIDLFTRLNSASAS
jgi:colanic acid biosynthesis glycosyl transferase WcaI